MIRSVSDIGDIKGKRVLVRVDFNVPITDGGTVTKSEAWRITQGLKTIHYLMHAGARVVIISHIGRKPNESLKPIHDYLLQQGEDRIGFIPSLTSSDIPNIIHDLQEGSAILLENLRSNPGEERNDPVFAELLASYADYFVNDAFSVSHRGHASVVGISQLLPSYAGFQFMDELQNLEAMRNPEHPSVVIIGGAKFETKLPVIRRFLETAETVVLGGALANTLLQARGYQVGGSIVDGLDLVTEFKDNPKLLVPIDVIVVGINGQPSIAMADAVFATDVIVDIGPATTKMIAEKIANAKTVLWNGPLGWYEKGYTQSSFAIADALAQSYATTVVGGGDTVTALHERDALNSISFVSTAGGAMLEYLAQGTLPGIESLS